MAYTIELTVTSKTPIQLCVDGWDATLPNTRYFSRMYGTTEAPFVGTVTLHIPMVIEPDKALTVRAYNATNGSNKGISISYLQKPLVVNYSKYSAEVQEFISTALWVAKYAKVLSPKMYFSKKNTWKINLIPQLIDPDTYAVKKGEVAHAWLPDKDLDPIIAGKTIEVSSVNIKNLSVTNVCMVLFHEFMHLQLNTLNELDCDKGAFNMLMDLGFSQFEVLCTLLNLFDGCPQGSEQEQRAEQLYQLIQARNHITLKQ
jgi:hypothetical protein